MTCPAPATGERRATLRQSSDLEGYCEGASGHSDEVWWLAQVRDLTPRGIGLLVQHRFEPGTLLLIELSSVDHCVNQTFRARVVHATLEEGGWLLGCVYPNVLEEAGTKT
jgi:hypothetical protein